MAEGGIIYTKTIDASVQDGVDNSLIIQPNYAYQKKFVFGGDWEHIAIGFFISYTNSITDNNKSFVSGQADVSSGGSSKDTNTYYGIIKDSPTKYLPEVVGQPLLAGQMFFGAMHNNLERIESPASYRNRFLDGDNSYGGSLLLSNEVNTTRRYSNNSGNMRSTIPLTRSSDTTNFAAYFGLDIIVNNKGLSNQTITVSSRNRNQGYSGYTDISLMKIKSIINSNTIDPDNTAMDTNDHTKDGAALPLPDSFFFYNAFLTVRPRIHAIAVKKLS